jgi:hypothetical protein
MKIVRESLNELPTWEELVSSAPEEIKQYVEKMKETPQGTDWHPEGNCYRHVRLVYDRAAATGDINLALAAFFHDLGKVDTTAPNKRGGWSAHGHERVSARIADRNKQWIEEMGGDSNEVIEVVRQHMRIKQMDVMKPAKQQAMRDNPYFDKLNKFTKFDDMKTLSKDELNRYK